MILIVNVQDRSGDYSDSLAELRLATVRAVQVRCTTVLGKSHRMPPALPDACLIETVGLKLAVRLSAMIYFLTTRQQALDLQRLSITNTFGGLPPADEQHA